MWGAIIGDIIGSVYEAQNIKTKNFELFSENCRFTDDTVCTVAVADALINGKTAFETFRTWGKKYKDIQNPPGFFPTFFSGGFAAWLESDNPVPYGAKTNGCVMRISPVPFLIRDLNTAFKTAASITNLTHNHPDSINAVLAYVRTVHMCQNGAQPFDIKNALSYYHGYNMNRTVDDIRPQYNKFYGSCHKSVPEAIICALEAISFEDAIRNAVSLGGDSDTLACMAGAIAETRFGIPTEIKDQARTYLPNEILNIMDKMYDMPVLIKLNNRLSSNKSDEKIKE